MSGLLKLLHPHGEWTHGELREYLEFALGRAPRQGAAQEARAHDYAKTSFSYIERDTEREVWVEVPEQPEEANLVEAVIEAAFPEPAESDSDTDLADGGRPHCRRESRAVEFKSSARWS